MLNNEEGIAQNTKITENHNIDLSRIQTSTRPKIFRKYGVFCGIIILLLILTAIIAPNFFSAQNILNIARQSAIGGVVAIGMTFVILTSGIDLSVGSILQVCGVLFAVMISNHLSIPVAICLTLLIGLLGGAVNAIGITFFGIQPFIMTLASMATGAGLALLFSNGNPITFSTNSALINFLGNGSVGHIPGPFIILVATIIIAFITLRYLPFGRFVYAIGNSQEAARLSGIRTTRVLLIVYAISGVCAALAGLLNASQLYVGDPTTGSTVMLNSIAAVVIGGTSLMGGRGSISGTVAGIFLLAYVSDLLNLLGVPPFDQQIVQGLIIVVAILLTSSKLRQQIKQAWASL